MSTRVDLFFSSSLRFSLDPLLTLIPGPFQTANDKALFGALGDSVPDRWGRVLMRRAERRRTEQDGEAPRTLQEIDCLLMVNDQARQGALRFAYDINGPFLATQKAAKIPPLIDLPKLLSAAEHVADDTDVGEDLILKTEIKKVVDWNKVDKADYLSAMERSTAKDVEIK